ncbi:MMPL family transporter [Actinokineospora terrae]|uniref:Putative drug exporter of the RND superfamily n=1 Tax=Actinokineospora terrae TaxID=155974 RepID=A0A1H9XPI0_9PSEU|nr:MMPL family transporter [Actinokineospora terrae]SES48064.1 putative drug exporter of the RND superfamily [Actinokineospora terrae]
MAVLLYRLGLTSVRRRVLVVLVWLLVFVASGVGAVTLSGATVTAFRIPGQESTTALEVMGERFGSAAGGGSAQVVLQAPAGRTLVQTQVAEQVSGLAAELRRLPGVVAATDPVDAANPVVSKDQRIGYSTVSYGVTAPEVTDDQRTALTSLVERSRADGLTVEVRGDVLQAKGQVGGPAEMIGVVVALLVLAITYGSLVSAGMNLLTAVVGVGIGALGITTLTGFIDLQATTPVLAVMLGLAVGIDYALFIITRFRHELLAGRPVEEAAAMAVGTAGSAVVTAGLTVVIALAGLSVAGIPFLTEMGLAAAGTIVFAVLIAVTLVPAMLGFVGRKALPRRSRVEGSPVHADHGFYRRWSHGVTRHPWLTLLAAVVVLLVIAIPVLSLRTSLVQHPDRDSTQAHAEQLVETGFGPGFSAPLLILIDGADAVTRAPVIRDEVAAQSDIAVVAPARPNQANTAALITVIPASGPDSTETNDLVHALRDNIADTPGAQVYVTGTTAVSIDISHKLDQALPIYLALVVGLAFILLILVFRSILVPVVGVLGFLLTIGAVLGATTAVFQWGWLSAVVNSNSTGPLMSLSPIIIVGILFGLAMDYQVFLVARMHEAYAHGAEPRTAIVTGFGQSAPVVVAAATIMFAVFAGFVPEGDATIKPIGFALAMGILFDAIIVRMIAVPAALTLLGHHAWSLPTWLHWLPELDVEGAALERDIPTQSTTEPTPEAHPTPHDTHH